MTVSSDRLIVFPSLQAPPNPIIAEGAVFRGMTTTQMEAEYSDSSFFKVRAADLDVLLGPGKVADRFKAFKWTVLELTDTVVPAQCYFGLVNLLSGAWRNEIAWQEHMHSGERYDRRPRPRKFRLTDSFLDRFNAGSVLLRDERRLRIAFLRWTGSFQRSDPLDTVLDCCSALEASFQMGDELRLRTALAVYFSLKSRRREAFHSVYKMYGVRSKFIHGATIPDVSDADRRRYIEIVATLLLAFIASGKVPDSEILNRSIVNHFGGGGR